MGIEQAIPVNLVHSLKHKATLLVSNQLHSNNEQIPKYINLGYEREQKMWKTDNIQ